jgi:hypothetical protein
MRGKTLVSIFAMLTAAAAWAQPPASAPRVVYLQGLQDMEKLKAANPDHYARAERIIAASDELCKPGPDQIEYVQFAAKDISCQGMLLRTSNPPKRQIGFTLDDVRYVALVTLNDAAAEFRRVPAQVAPAEPAK